MEVKEVLGVEDLNLLDWVHRVGVQGQGQGRIIEVDQVNWDVNLNRLSWYSLRGQSGKDVRGVVGSSGAIFDLKGKLGQTQSPTRETTLGFGQVHDPF